MGIGKKRKTQIIVIQRIKSLFLHCIFYYPKQKNRHKKHLVLSAKSCLWKTCVKSAHNMFQDWQNLWKTHRPCFFVLLVLF